MQHIWEAHVHDLHGLINAELMDQPDVQVILEKSLEHIDLMAASLAPFYGQDVANTVDQLLHQHEAALYAYVVAAEAGDQAGMQAAAEQNAQVVDQISIAFSLLNPNWPFEVVKAAFDQHVNDLVTITQQMLAGDFVGALNTLDVAVEHAQAFANTMTNGLVAQFPDRFA